MATEQGEDLVVARTILEEEIQVRVNNRTAVPKATSALGRRARRRGPKMVLKDHGFTDEDIEQFEDDREGLIGAAVGVLWRDYTGGNTARARAILEEEIQVMVNNYSAIPKARNALGRRAIRLGPKRVLKDHGLTNKDLEEFEDDSEALIGAAVQALWSDYVQGSERAGDKYPSGSDDAAVRWQKSEISLRPMRLRSKKSLIKEYKKLQKRLQKLERALKRKGVDPTTITIAMESEMMMMEEQPKDADAAFNVGMARKARPL